MIKKIKINLVIVINLILLVACSGPDQKSIIEPLTVKEKAELFKNDSLYQIVFDQTDLIKDSINDKLYLYEDVTYKNVYDYNFIYKDTSESKLAMNNYKLEWQKEFSDIDSKFDTVINHWVELAKQNDLSKYANIELVAIDKEYYSYSHRLKDVNLGFKITALEGSIDQIIFTYNLKPKIKNQKKSDDPMTNYYQTLNSLSDSKRCLYSRPIKSSKIGYWEADYSQREMLGSRSVKSLLRDYNINIEIEKIRKNEINYSNDDIDMPFEIEQYLKEVVIDESYMVEYYKNKIIQEYVDSDFVNLQTFKINKNDSIRKAREPRVQELFNEVVKS